MANTYTSLFYHIVFSTKYRKPWIVPEIENRVWAHFGGIARKHKMAPIRIGGIEDHIHALVRSGPTFSPSTINQLLKGESSKWVHDNFSELWGFNWQDGFGAFSVSKSDVPRVVRYIENQRRHHKRMSYEDEFRELLRLHEIDIVDEKYLFG